jgi:hypothetical protein
MGERVFLLLFRRNEKISSRMKISWCKKETKEEKKHHPFKEENILSLFSLCV